LITFDTNILVYALDRRQEEKRAIAAELLATLVLSSTAVILLQSLTEFYNASTRKQILTSQMAHSIIRQYQDLWTVVPATSSDLTAAMMANQEHGWQFFDAMIWATARRAGCTILLTEDFQHNRVADGVRFVNPFLLTTRNCKSFISAGRAKHRLARHI
jgi:predicted nucleic acid-binding protein